MTVELDEVDWIAQIWALNTWADPNESTQNIIEAARLEAFSRWKRGRDAWNAWAYKMLALRRKAENSIAWLIQDVHAKPQVGRNEFTKRFLLLANVDFSAHTFGDSNFSQFVFPASASFNDAKFTAEADFSCAAFHGSACFHDCSFKEADFTGCEFHNGAWFSGTQWTESPEFVEATFKKGTAFTASAFSDGARFVNSTFSGGWAWFNFMKCGGDLMSFAKCRFDDRAMFDKTDFGSENTDFHVATFNGPATFWRATLRNADFSGAQSGIYFGLLETTFSHVPDFGGAHFSETPLLDGASICYKPTRVWPLEDKKRNALADPRPFGFGLFKAANNPNVHTRFRALRAMAQDGNDHHSQLRFNAEEIVARRFWVDHPFDRKTFFRFWIGMCYQMLSEFGTSVARPLLCNAILVVAFALAYLAISTQYSIAQFNSECHCTYVEDQSRQSTTKVVEAFSLSIKNAVPFDRADASKRIYGCLFGIEGDGRSWNIPPLVGILSLIQTVGSALLVFLFGLGLRNMFRLG